MSLDDETALEPNDVNLAALGTIRVDIFRVSYRGKKPENYRADNYGSLDSHTVVNEKTKKAGCHRVQYVLSDISLYRSVIYIF